MATKEMDLKGMNRKGHGLCTCCDSPNCGKRKGPYPKKRTPARNGQKQKASWRSGNVNEWNNDYYLKPRVNKHDA